MNVLYITSLLGGDGKTAFCAGLSYLMRQRGQTTALFKPVRLGQPTPSSEPDADAAFFARLQGSPFPSGWPLELGLQEAREGLLPLSRQRIAAMLQHLSGQATEVIVEGPPMTSPQGETVTAAREMADATDARAILLVRYSTKLTSEDVLAAARALEPRLLGVVINAVPRYRGHDANATLITPLQQAGVHVLAVLPEERRLLGVTVGQLAQHLGGEFLAEAHAWEEKQDQLLDHLMIGGLVLDWGVHYFGQSETKAVIVRGDRPDIQMAALRTPTQCLVLTGGHRPVQYIEHEAREEGVPVVLVQSDTLTTVQALETLFDRAPAHHAQKAECFARLLSGALAPGVLTPAQGKK
ncbi:MAG: DRTGG domain-containing protein [Dehalococcoidia bacterium]|nr:DRTGG domain-containing protein [Dehalococcoidia bacterium]